MYESLSMLFVSLCCVAQLFNFVSFLSLADEIKLLKGRLLSEAGKVSIRMSGDALDTCHRLVVYPPAYDRLWT